jgi:hypothetical protein
MAFIINKRALVVDTLRPSVGPLAIKISICIFAFIYTTIFEIGLLAEAISLVILKLPLISTIIGDQDTRAIHLVIVPVPFILTELLVICGKIHLAFALSFAILQLAGVETSLLVLLYSLIYLAAALFLSILHVLLVISLIGCP